MTLNVCDTNHQKSIATSTKIPSYPFFKCITYKGLPDTAQTNHSVEQIHSREIEEEVLNISKRAETCSSQVLLSSHSEVSLACSLCWTHLLSSSPKFAGCVCVLPSPHFMKLSERRNRFSELQESHFSFYSFLTDESFDGKPLKLSSALLWCALANTSS